MENSRGVRPAPQARRERASWTGVEAAVFLGTFTPRLDEKSRLILPAKFRDELAGGLVVTKGQERCLFVFPRRAFEELTAAVAAAPLTSAGPRHYARMLFSSAHDEVPDKQGRITIPAPLRSYAGIDRDLAVVGANNRLEIWAADAWARYTEAQDDTFADLPDGLVF